MNKSEGEKQGGVDRWMGACILSSSPFVLSWLQVSFQEKELAVC